LVDRYLDTVSWWGPAEGDEPRRDQLACHLSDVERIRSGYDPWGRLVVRSQSLFVVEWPVGTSGSPAEGAVIAAERSRNTGAQPVFVDYPDGRLEPLPAAPSPNLDTDFLWGYSGQGPRQLAAALDWLCTEIEDRPAFLRERRDFHPRRPLWNLIVNERRRCPRWTAPELRQRLREGRRDEGRTGEARHSETPHSP
jgi:hypothetical protein